MSRRNKVNPDHYTIAGRLAPDDLARERRKQAESMFGATRGRQRKPLPPWMASDTASDTNNTTAGAGDEDVAVEAGDAGEAVSMNETDIDEAAQKPQAKPRAATTKRKKAGTTRAARSATAKSRSTAKTSGARRALKGGKAPKARSSGARAASPPRAGKRKAQKTASRGTQRATLRQNAKAKKAKTAKKAKSAKKR